MKTIKDSYRQLFFHIRFIMVTSLRFVAITIKAFRKKKNKTHQSIIQMCKKANQLMNLNNNNNNKIQINIQSPTSTEMKRFKQFIQTNSNPNPF